MPGGLLHPLFTLTPESRGGILSVALSVAEVCTAAPRLERKLSTGTLSYDVRTFLRISLRYAATAHFGFSKQIYNKIQPVFQNFRSNFNRLFLGSGFIKKPFMDDYTSA